MAKEVDRPLSRAAYNRLLIANAATKPVPNVLVPAAIAGAGLLIALPWPALLVALVAYMALAVITYFDEDEADRVLKEERARRRGRLERRQRANLDDLAPPIAERVRAALDREARIGDAVERAELPFEEVSTEVDGLVRAMEGTAGRAQLIHDYLAEQRPEAIEARLAELRAGGAEDDPGRRRLVEALSEQLAAVQGLQAQLRRFFDEMEHLVVSLDTVHGQIVAAGASAEDAAQRELAGQVRDLRREVGALAEGMREAYADAGAAPARRAG
jgi:hypothetical protein